MNANFVYRPPAFLRMALEIFVAPAFALTQFSRSGFDETAVFRITAATMLVIGVAIFATACSIVSISKPDSAPASFLIGPLVAFILCRFVLKSLAARVPSRPPCVHR